MSQFSKVVIVALSLAHCFEFIQCLPVSYDDNLNLGSQEKNYLPPLQPSPRIKRHQGYNLDGTNGGNYGRGLNNYYNPYGNTGNYFSPGFSPSSFYPNNFNNFNNVRNPGGFPFFNGYPNYGYPGSTGVNPYGQSPNSVTPTVTPGTPFQSVPNNPSPVTPVPPFQSVPNANQGVNPSQTGSPGVYQNPYQQTSGTNYPGGYPYQGNYPGGYLQSPGYPAPSYPNQGTYPQSPSPQTPATSYPSSNQGQDISPGTNPNQGTYPQSNPNPPQTSYPNSNQGQGAHPPSNNGPQPNVPNNGNGDVSPGNSGTVPNPQLNPTGVDGDNKNGQNIETRDPGRGGNVPPPNPSVGDWRDASNVTPVSKTPSQDKDSNVNLSDVDQYVDN